jgi:hypothetical protein
MDALGASADPKLTLKAPHPTHVAADPGDASSKPFSEKKNEERERKRRGKREKRERRERGKAKLAKITPR